MGRSLAELAIESRKPLFWMKGRPVFPIMGGSGEGEGGTEEQPDETEEEPDDSESDQPGDPRIKELSDENARRRNEAKRLQKELEDAQKRLKEIDDAGKSETERLQAQNEELTATNEKLIKGIEALTIKNAFLADKTRSWRNPEAALKLIDLSGVSIDDNGNATGLKDAIKKLSETDSYLLEPKDESGRTPPPQPSGDKTPSGRKTPKEKSREELERRFPALQGR